MDQEKVGKFIKEIRKKNNLTQKQFADKLGVTFQAVSKWETAKNIPDIAILKEISRIFNIDINEILEGESKENKTNIPKKKKTIIITSILLLTCTIFIAIILNNHNRDRHDFEFKQISTSCNNFNITGSMAYNKDKTSLYISSVEFCGNSDNEIYSNISCNLYENYNGNENKISTCKNNNNITLEEYLKEVKISVDDYKLSCHDTTDTELYLEINATLEDNKHIVYKIPITLLDNNCNTK